MITAGGRTMIKKLIQKDGTRVFFNTEAFVKAHVYPEDPDYVEIVTLNGSFLVKETLDDLFVNVTPSGEYQWSQ